MNDGDARDLDTRIEELRREADRLEQVTQVMQENMGKMVLRGLVNAVVFLPLTGLTMYLAARLALRKKR